MADFFCLPYMHAMYLGKYASRSERLITPCHWYMLHSGFRLEGANEQIFEYKKNGSNKIELKYIRGNWRCSSFYSATENGFLIENAYFKNRQLEIDASPFFDSKWEFKCLPQLFTILERELRAMEPPKKPNQPLVACDAEQLLQLCASQATNAQHLIQTGTIQANESSKQDSRQSDLIP